MIIEIVVSKTFELEIDETLLPGLAADVRERFEIEDGGGVYMADIIGLALDNGDIEKPEWWNDEYDWDVSDDWSEPMTDAELQSIIDAETGEL